MVNNLSPYAKVKVYWDDAPENYSKETKAQIKSAMAKKYGFNKNNVDVIFKPIKVSDTGEVIEINGSTIDNIMDIQHQRELMREWIKRENKIVDFDRIVSLDEKVNAELTLENDLTQHSNWGVKWLMIDNFLCFGEGNFIPLNKVKGLVVVNSLPENTGGKTTLTIDSMKFLLHGNTTKTDKNEEIFNQFTDKNELTVRGMITIGDDEVIVERKMKRTVKKAGGWTISNKVNYYNLLPDGTEELQNDEHAKKTTIKLRESIGSEKDFEMLALATEKNLDDLIGLTSTESGRILTRLIGLEIIEKKEEVVRKMYNEFDKKKKSNTYNIVNLTTEIETHNENIEAGQGVEINLINKLDNVKKQIEDLNKSNDELIAKKIKIDVVISALNPSKLEEDINLITDKGKGIAAKREAYIKRIEAIGDITLDEDEYYLLNKSKNNLQVDIQVKTAETNRLRTMIQNLIDGGICKACNRKLDSVDNSEHIKRHEANLKKINEDISQLKIELLDVENKLNTFTEAKNLNDEKNKLELDRDRAEVELSSLRNKIVEKRNDLKKYKLNEDSIEHNKKIDIEISLVKTKINVAAYDKDEIFSKFEKIKQDIEINKQNIEIKNKLIDQIKREAEIEKIFKLYIDLVGKKGISKLVLRSVLPVINSEIQRLLDDVVDFEIEIFIDDKNDVQFVLIKDGINKPLKSGSGLEKTAASLALRAVLGKVSNLPMPNFITFDEVLGKVANINIEKLKPLFDKIKDMYDTVFLITHNDIVKDWSTNIITVIKENNVSKITIK